MANKNERLEDEPLASQNRKVNKAESDGTSINSNDTTDADNDSVTTGRIAATERGSASSTKTNVTGSDLDGQTSF